VHALGATAPKALCRAVSQQATPALVRQLMSGSKWRQENAAMRLAIDLNRMARCSRSSPAETTQAAIAAQQPGAIPMLAGMLDSGSMMVQDCAALVLVMLASSSSEMQAAIAAQPGAIAALDQLMGSDLDAELAQRSAARLELGGPASASRQKEQQDGGGGAAAACAGCGALPAAGGSHKVCKGCRALRYCSVDCQKRHWAQHKRTCKARRAAELCACVLLHDLG
jgi:hypothetical protein